MLGFAVSLMLASQSAADDAPIGVGVGSPTRITIRAEDAGLGPHGPSRRVRVGVTFDGILHVFALAPGRDPFLRMESSAGGAPIEDDDSGGGTTPYVDREVRPGEEITIDLAVDVPSAADPVGVELHVEASPETAATREAADVAMRRLGELLGKPGQTRGDLRDGMRAILDDLFAVPGSRESRLATGAGSRIGVEAFRHGSWTIARDAMSISLARADRIRPPDDPRVQMLRGDLGAAFEESGDLDRAAELKNLAFESLSRTCVDDDPALQIARIQRASLLSLRFRYADAVPLLRTAIGHLAPARAPSDDALVKARTLLGRALLRIGDTAAAQAEFEAIIAAPGMNLAAVLRARGELARVLKDSGELRQALVLQEFALAEAERSLPPDHPVLGDAMIELAATLGVIGDYLGSKALYERQIAALERNPPENPGILRSVRSDLGVALMSLGEHERARRIHQDLVDEIQAAESVGEEERIHRLAVLATTLSAMGRSEEAIPMQRRVDEAWTRWFGPDDQKLLSHRLNFAISLLNTGALDEARDLARDVLERRERILPPGDAMLQRACNVNLMVAVGRGDEAAAMTLAERVIASVVRGISDAILVMSPREAEQVARQRASGINLVLSHARAVEDEARRRHLYEVVWSAVETSRSAATTSARMARRIAPTLDDAAAATLRNEIVAARIEVASRANAGNPEALVAATRRLEAAERALRERLSGRLRFEPPTLDALAAAVPEATAAVSYWSYLDELGSNSRRMVALVVRHESEPIAIDLGSLADLSAAVERWRGSIRIDGGRAKRLDSFSRETDATRSDPTTAGDALRRLAFDPLRAAIGDATRLIFVPDDVLHLVPFDALPDDSGGKQCLGDRFAIEVRSSLTDRSDLTESADPSDPSDSIERADMLVLGGGIDFGPAHGTKGFAPLPETGPEIEAIARLRREASGPDSPIEQLVGAAATKSRLLALAPRARFLHLATHGEFGGAADGPAPAASSDDAVRGFAPLTLCGVALAGANAVAGDDGRRDGILTGEEIAAIDLSGCELAVLSACETNVGERRAGQGIASLQTALSAAGARTTITSLWRVPDEATHALMVEFYRRVWVLKQPKARALWDAKRVLRDRGTPVAGWAAWVMTGDPD